MGWYDDTLNDGDGFIRIAGKAKGDRIKRTHVRASAEQDERHDKRSAKLRQIRRLKREWSED